MKINLLIVFFITVVAFLFKFIWHEFTVIDILLLITPISAQLIYVKHFLKKRASSFKMLIFPFFIVFILGIYFYS